MKNKWILFVIVFVVLCIFLSISLKNNDNKLFLGNRKIEEQSPLQFQQLNRLYTSFGDDFSKKLFFAKLEEDLKGSFLPMLKIMLPPPHTHTPLSLKDLRLICHLLQKMKLYPILLII
ncbi:MAG: hypothetical protein LBS38_01865 [Endomicrobium sp.]|jgi:hypothetical protein|nr:hypothetical protein [Endomicrobium sp.]